MTLSFLVFVMATSFFSRPPARILVVTLRYLGDTLLVTPLLNSLKNAYPQAQIDVLLYENTAAMLAGNPAVSHLITTVAKPHWQEHLKIYQQIFRRYDLAVCTQTGDKPTLYSFLAAPIRIGLVPQRPQTGWFKRYLYQRWLEFDTQKTHTVLELLKLCSLLDIAPIYQLTPPQPDFSSLQKLQSLNLPDNYVVLHPMPQWRYKQWTVAGWEAIAEYCHQQGLKVLISGSSLAAELAYLAKLQLPDDTLNLAGKLSLAELAQIISGAKLFVGCDTGITHLAAATGVATIALFGPSDPVKWTPWPVDYHSDKPPFVTHGNQQVNNVYLIQGQKDCVPCYLEGCERHQQSYSACLDAITPAQVQAVIATILKL
jgi:heptosyltransferase-3